MTITTVLVTGANRGIGLEFVKLLVKHAPAPRVIVATCRDPSKATVHAVYFTFVKCLRRYRCPMHALSSQYPFPFPIF